MFGWIRWGMVGLLCSTICWAQEPKVYRVEYAILSQPQPQNVRDHDVRLSKYLPRLQASAPQDPVSPSFLEEKLSPILGGDIKLIAQGAFLLSDNHPFERIDIHTTDEDQPSLGTLDIRKRHFFETRWRLNGSFDGMDFFLSQDRRTRSGILNYLDHPTVAVVFGVWPVEALPEPSTPAEE